MQYTINTKAILILIISIIISNFITIYLNNKYKLIYNISTEETTYIGTIISNEKKGQYKNSYTIKIESINGNKEYKNIRLILNISNKENVKLEYGNKIKFKGTYNAPEVRRNYRGFDYSEYLKTLKIYGIVTYSGNGLIKIKKENLNKLQISIKKISTKLENNIKKLYQEETAGLLIGILLGNNENIEEEIKDDFRNSGIYHILAVSGAHMSYIILGITYLLDKISISRKKKDIFKMLGIVFFMLITNTSISVIRAGIMGIITLGASFFCRRKDITNSVCISMLIILIYNPHSINSISFKLSYGGVIGILLLNNPYTKILRKAGLNIKISETISVILSAQTMIIPIMILNFHTISLTFIFANIVVGYLIGAIIILGFTCAFLSLISLKIASFISIFLNILLKVLILIAKTFGNIPLSKIYVITPSMISILLYYIIICINSIKSKKRISKFISRETLRYYNKKVEKIIIIILIISQVFNSYIHIPKNLQIYFIDVGQGDSSLVITPSNKKILIDGGGTMNSSEGFDLGEDTLLPYLLNRGIKDIDYMMISHFDADHCQALIAILKSLKVKNIIISKQAEKVYNYKKIMEIVVNKKINIMVIKRGDVINVDNNVDIKIIYPESKLYFDDINSNSIVAKLIYNNFTQSRRKNSKNCEKRTKVYNIKSSTSWVKNIHHRGIYRSGKARNCTNRSRKK